MILHINVSNTGIHLMLMIMILIKSLMINRYIVYVDLKVHSNDMALFQLSLARKS